MRGRNCGDAGVMINDKTGRDATKGYLRRPVENPAPDDVTAFPPDGGPNIRAHNLIAGLTTYV